MNVVYPEKIYEKNNEIKGLEKVAKNLEKQCKNISLILKNVKSKDFSINDFNDRKPSYRSKGTPRNVSRIHLSTPRTALYEDLTEITVTDVVSDPTDTFPLNEIADINFKNIHSHRPQHWINNLNLYENFVLLIPDSSYKNLSKFHERQILKENKTNTIDNKITFPLLQIDTPMGTLNQYKGLRKKESILPEMLLSSLIHSNENNIYNIIDLVSPEIILKNQSNKKQLEKPVQTRFKEKKEFIKQNLLNFTIDEEKSLDCSGTHLQEKDITPAQKTFDHKLDYSEKDKVAENSNVLSDSDVIIHRGYIITSDGVTDSKSKKSIRDDINPVDKSEKFELSEPHNNYQSSHIDLVSEFEMDTLLSKGSDRSKIKPLNNGMSGTPAISNDPVSIQLPSMPILPPDILGNINLHTGNKVKKFLGVKSIDESGWNDVKDIDINTSFLENKPKKELNLVMNPKIRDNDGKVNLDDFTATAFGLNGYQNNLRKDVSQSLKEMDNKIEDMDKISSLIEKRFSNSKMMSLKCTDEAPVMENKLCKTNIQGNKLEKPLVLLHTLEEESHSEANTALLSDSYCTVSSDVLKLMGESSTKEISNIPQLDLSSIDSNNYIKPQERKLSTRNIKMRKAHSTRKNNVRRFRNEAEKNNYLRRKMEGRNLALKNLYQLGLPPEKSSEVQVKLMEGPTPNEMMLSEIKRNDQVSLFRLKEPLTYTQSPEIIKHKNPKSYLEKVRLQRPEVTRTKNLKKEYSLKNGLPLQTDSYQNGRTIPRFQQISTPRSVISQDTDATSVISNWSVPDNVNQILFNDLLNDRLKYGDEPSQIISIQSNSFIDWDQVSEMIRSPTLK